MRRTDAALIAEQWDYHFIKQRTLRLRAMADAAPDSYDPDVIRADEQRRLAVIDRDAAREFSRLREWTSALVRAWAQRDGATTVRKEITDSLRRLAELLAESATKVAPTQWRRRELPPLAAGLLASVTLAPRAPAHCLTAMVRL
ncbi:MAG: hypothetical protein IT299_00760 [Dehalococcoidia bacterium]|nr:hypothetical protein [Dehalococcoidia bacterium]